MSIDTDIAAVSVIDRSVTLNGSAQQVLAPNTFRKHLMMQCNAASLWYSFVNPNPAANAHGCFYLAAGATFSALMGLPSNGLWVIGTSGDTLALTEG